jgi:hypothetical protein
MQPWAAEVPLECFVGLFGAQVPRYNGVVGFMQ